MSNNLTIAQDFVHSLTIEEREQLFNELLALEDVHKHNKHISYFTMRNMKRLGKGRNERCKRTLRYMGIHNDELLVHQFHEQRLFKNEYRIQIFFNMKEYDYSLVEQILSILRQPAELQSGRLFHAYA